MPVRQPQVSIALPLRPKSYILTVEYKGGWPSFISYDYHYHKLEELMKHVEWIASQMKGQNGKSAKRRNVVTGLLMRERLRSKRVDKELPPIGRFVRPKDREKPAGGKPSVNVKLD
jgi:hypothetical protein